MSWLAKRSKKPKKLKKLKKSGSGEAVLVNPHIPGWPSTERWTPVATFLATMAAPETWPEIDDGVVVNPHRVEIAMRGLPWKAASKSSRKLAGRLGWLLATGLRALDREVIALQSKVGELELIIYARARDCEAIALQSKVRELELVTYARALEREVTALLGKVRELEREVVALRAAKVIAREVNTTQAEQCYEQQCTIQQLVSPRHKYVENKVLISQVHAPAMKSPRDPKEWDGNVWGEYSDFEIEI